VLSGDPGGAPQLRGPVITDQFFVGQEAPPVDSSHSCRLFSTALPTAAPLAQGQRPRRTVRIIKIPLHARFPNQSEEVSLSRVDVFVCARASMDRGWGWGCFVWVVCVSVCTRVSVCVSAWGSGSVGRCGGRVCHKQPSLRRTRSLPPAPPPRSIPCPSPHRIRSSSPSPDPRPSPGPWRPPNLESRLSDLNTRLCPPYRARGKQQIRSPD